MMRGRGNMCMVRGRARRMAAQLRRTRSSPEELRNQLASAVGSQQAIHTLGLLERGVDPNVRVPAAGPRRGLRSLPASRSASRAAPPRSLSASRQPSRANGRRSPRFGKFLPQTSTYGDRVRFDLDRTRSLEGTTDSEEVGYSDTLGPSDGGTDNLAYISDDSEGYADGESAERSSSAGSETLLHRAARSGSAAVVQMLLDHGADPAARDSAGRTPLHTAALVEAPADVVRLLVAAKGAQLDAQDHVGDTALHCALRVHNRKHIILMLEAGARSDIRNHRGRTAIRYLVGEFPQAIDIAFDASIHIRRPLGYGARAVEFDYSLFDPRLLDDDPEPHTKYLETRLMNTIENTDIRDRLFLHPLCRSFLNLKWKVIQPFFIFDVMMFALFVASFNTFVFSIVDTKMKNNTIPNIQQSQKNTSTLQDLGMDFDISIFNVPLSTISFWFVAVLCLYINTREITKLWVMGLRSYSRGLENLILWFCTSTAITCLCTDQLQFHNVRQVASVCLLVSWTELLFLLGRAEFASIHVMLFVTLIRTLTFFMMVYTAVTFAFTSSFFVLFYEHEAFSTMWQSFFTTVVMSIGELNYEPNMLIGSDVGYAIYLLFIFFMLIITMNAMVGMAVNDTRDLAAKAQIKLLKKYLEFAFIFERHMQYRAKSTLWKAFPTVGITMLSMLPDNCLVADWQYLRPEAPSWRQSWKMRFAAGRSDDSSDAEKIDYTIFGAVLRSWLAEWPDVLREATSIVMTKRQIVTDDGAEMLTNSVQTPPADQQDGKMEAAATRGKEEQKAGEDNNAEEGEEDENGDVGDGANGDQGGDGNTLNELRVAVLDLKCQLRQIHTELFKISKTVRGLAWKSDHHLH